VDEWYKAAYYDPAAGVYYDYPTGSDNIPDGIDFAGDTTFDAVFNQGGANPMPNDVTDVGVLSPYGAAAQGGNVWEWEESESDLINDSTLASHGIRGIDWSGRGGGSSYMRASFRGVGGFTGSELIGFRVTATADLRSEGDYNGDGFVDAADYVMWRHTNGLAPNYNVWRAHFGSSISASGVGYSGVVPESSASLVFTLAALIFLYRRESASHNRV
jgi:Sulfatase-modifying factor enzyme 1